jgi:hypothetical protein
MKQYFLNFDFFNSEINKFYFGVVTFDLSTGKLIDLAKTIITDNFENIDPEKVTIRVNVLNNIEL